MPLNKRLVGIFEATQSKEAEGEKKDNLPLEASINDPIHGI